MRKISYLETVNHYEKLRKESGVDPEEIHRRLVAETKGDPCKIVVLDDDPTGIQAVHGVYVFTDYEVSSLEEGLTGAEKVFFVLTNSRALTQEQTLALHKKIAQNLLEASKNTSTPFLLVSRGDSTLRGHFPAETEALKEQLEQKGGISYDGEILAPFFQAGGRLTVSNVHYVKYEDELIPAGETEFARDKTFEYQSSDLRDYIEEKTKGRYPAKETVEISLEDLRRAAVEEIASQLMKRKDFGKIVVNALDQTDMEVFCLALYKALRGGKHFLFRTAADFVKAAGGIGKRDLLSGVEMKDEGNQNGGIIVVGSHTEKTTKQLERLRELKELFMIEFNSDLVLSDDLEGEILRVTDEAQELMKKGKTVVVYTKRKLLSLKGETKEEALKRSVKISDAVQRLVGDLEISPSFVIAKGGITSSDIGVKALRVRKAYVPGQAQPGVPVWKTGDESKFPYIPYIIFPGNVGDEDTLKKIVVSLTEKKENADQ